MLPHPRGGDRRPCTTLNCNSSNEVKLTDYEDSLINRAISKGRDKVQGQNIQRSERGNDYCR